MSKSKFEEFHVPFIKNLVFVALVTVVSMISVRYYLTKTLSLPPNTTIYTSSESQISPK
jgi:uncharacterized membrane protein AbrB (regulator of aidB expression)